uniref:Uncharacterized protein n=1 Tax=Physcomitrium patens TaxID=3218 RepID=A0A2K1LAQ0_PHYPA|nr:hypothetical protein PHYPA_001530 [Physcomitrium patens]
MAESNPGENSEPRPLSCSKSGRLRTSALARANLTTREELKVVGVEVGFRFASHRDVILTVRMQNLKHFCPSTGQILS